MNGRWALAPDCTILHKFSEELWRPTIDGAHEHWIDGRSDLFDACDLFQRGVALADERHADIVEDLDPWGDGGERYAAHRVWVTQMLSLRVELMERLRWWPEARAALWSTHDASEVETMVEELMHLDVRGSAGVGLDELDEIADRRDWCQIWFRARRAILKGLPE